MLIKNLSFFNDHFSKRTMLQCIQYNNSTVCVKWSFKKDLKSIYDAV